MRAAPKNRLSSTSQLARWSILPIAIAIGAFFGSQEPAYSRIEGGAQVAPFVSEAKPTVSATQASEKPVLPKAPAQVEMPAPPPMKYLAGLEETLVATGPVTGEEGVDLDAALKAFHEAPLNAPAGSDYSDYANPLIAFIEAHPQSQWNAALYLNLGLGYYHAGYYSRVFPMLEKAWSLGRNAQSVPAQRMVDRAVGELAEMHARLGHDMEIEALLADIGNRPIGGPGTELLQNARDALGVFRGNAGVSFLCGPRALKNVLVAQNAKPKQIQVADDARSGPHGFSLAELSKLSDKAGLKHVLIKREPGQPVPVPSIINFNVHHYAAVVGTLDGKYHLEDTTFGEAGGNALTAKAIDAESSGYFLVPQSVIAANPQAGWRTVSASSEEAKSAYGMGSWTNWSPNEPVAHQPKTCHGKAPMCSSSGIKVQMSLHLEDTPVGYQPQVGTMSAKTTISYNQRDGLQPATIPFSNLSGKWTHSWMSYMQDNPATVAINITRMDPSGAGNAIPAAYSNGGTYGAFNREITDASQLRRFPLPNNQPTLKFERHLADGSVELYDLNDGATTFPRRWFMTKFTDPMGNATVYHYDATLRITSVVDPMGRSTTFTYGLTSYPLLITQITDGFGRAAQITYDTSQRLASITDPAGITSSMTYSSTDPSFVTTLTTPYGTSTYSETNNPNDPPVSGQPATRTLTMKDPMGYTDYLYFYGSLSLEPGSDPAATVPTGWSSANVVMNYRNTYYWDKHQFAQGVTTSGGVVQSQDYSKAEKYHWVHEQSTLNLYGLLEASKKPLENRVWFSYQGQPSAPFNGVYNPPSAVGRVLDDGSTQKTSAVYFTSSGLVSPYTLTSQTDAAGRTTKNTYATTNYIDLLTVQQLTTSPSTYTTIATYGSYNTQHEPQPIPTRRERSGITHTTPPGNLRQ